MDKNCKIVPIYAYGVDTISSGINEVDMTNVAYLFGKLWTENINNYYGEVGVLIGINYASIQPQVEQTVGNLVLYKNRFGRCVVGTHGLLKGQGSPSIHLCILKNKKPLLENLFIIEQMGVNCTPKMWKLLEDGLTHKDNHWEVCYPWSKDPKGLPNNRQIENASKHRIRLLKDPVKVKTTQTDKL